MASQKYLESAENLIKAIDIAVEVFQKNPPKELNESHLTHVVNVYLEWKNMIQNAEPRFANLQSLKYSIEGIFTYFQEGSGEAVNVFWDKIKEQNLPYKRENKLAKILKRKKIKDDIEYNFVIDVLVPYQQENLIGETEVILLNKLIGEFESRNKHF